MTPTFSSTRTSPKFGPPKPPKMATVPATRWRPYTWGPLARPRTRALARDPGPASYQALDDLPVAQGEESMNNSAPARCRHGSRGRKVRESPLCAPCAPRPLHPFTTSRDHQVFAWHNKFGTFPTPKDFMNTTKESAADVAAVATKMADKMAAKQVAAEQAEAKQKTKMKKVKATKEEATKKVAEDAAPVEATKEEAAVHLARPHQCQWPIAWLGSAWKAAPPSPCGPCGHLRLWAKKDASSFRMLVLIGVAAAFCAAFNPHMTKPSVASKLVEINHPDACPPQWLPVLLASSSRREDNPAPRFDDEDLLFEGKNEALSMERRMDEAIGCADPDTVWACTLICHQVHRLVEP
eukprot:scaffold49346_cov51-Phaeocystis_antarctica.AAC.2